MNRSQLFASAHRTARKNIYKTYREAFRDALRAAWAAARGVVEVSKAETLQDIIDRLSIAARRALQFGATEKQINYLAFLIVKAGWKASDVIESGLLSKRKASFYIDAIKAA